MSRSIPPPFGGTWQDWAAWGSELSVAKGLNLKCTHVEAGRATFVLDGEDWFTNFNGAVNGGIVIACADHTFGLVATTLLDPQTVPATATFTSDFLRPAMPPITFHAAVDRIGRTMAFISVRVTDCNGKTLQRSSGNDGRRRFLQDRRGAGRGLIDGVVVSGCAGL